MMAPDLAVTRCFLDLLERDCDFTFQAFDDNADRRWGKLARVLHGPFEEHSDELGKLNDVGAGIFVMVNAGDGVVHDGARTCRTERNVTRVRALFVDLDGAPIAPVVTSAAPPGWVVQSSPGRWHAYWRVEPCPLAEFNSWQSAIAKRFGGDPAVKDLPRVMRLPGFVHRKGEPFVSRLFLRSEYTSLAGVAHE